jgi:hypothetical protein
MIDLQAETPLSLPAAARIIPPGRRGRPVSPSCLVRWILDGVKTPGGVVRLEAIRLGGRWITSVEALHRFADRQTPSFDDRQAPPSRSAVKRQRAAEQAGEVLDRIGI